MTDFRFALRQLRRSPGFTVVAVLTLALGIGLNTSLFSVLNVLLLRPLPYPHADRLVRIFGSTPEAHDWALTAATYRDLREADPEFESLALFAWWGSTVTEPGRPAELLYTLRTSADFLPALGMQPMYGRWFTPEEDKPDSPVALISHEYWLRHFGGDPGIVGRAVLLDQVPVTIIGVMPAELAAPTVFGVIDLWRPIGLTAAQWENREEKWIHAVARLAPGESIAHANATVRAIAARIAQDHPRENGQMSLRTVPLHASNATDAERTITWFTLGLAGFVLLIACANLANLQLARATGRAREFALRSALGASRLRLLRPLMIESLVLALLGGGSGLLVAVVCNDWIGRRIVLNNAPAGQDLPLDHRVLVFAGAIAIFTGLVFGTVPAWLASRTPLNPVIKDSGRGTTPGHALRRFRHALVIGECALALVLLVGAGLILGGMNRFLQRDAGWRTQGIAFGFVPTQTPKYRDLEQACDFYERMCERLGQLPGVEGVAFGWNVPVVSRYAPRQFVVEGRPPVSPDKAPLAFFTGVLPGYFSALGISTVDGRDITRRDRLGAPRVAIVNETMAHALWPGENAVGKRIAHVDPANPDPKDAWMEIVGVVSDVRWAGSLDVPPTRFQIYVPFRQEAWNWGAVALRTSAPPETLIEPMRHAIAEVDPDIPVWSARSVTQEIDRHLANSKLTSQLLGGVALLGLLLAALGIYGVIAFLVAQRTPEIGVRMALGADVNTIYRLVLGTGVRMALAGAAFGVVGALVLGRLMTSVAPGIPAAHPLLIVGVTAALMVVALIACWVPARRAARIDPVIALRNE